MYEGVFDNTIQPLAPLLRQRAVATLAGMYLEGQKDRLEVFGEIQYQ